MYQQLLQRQQQQQQVQQTSDFLPARAAPSTAAPVSQAQSAAAAALGGIEASGASRRFKRRLDDDAADGHADKETVGTAGAGAAWSSSASAAGSGGGLPGARKAAEAAGKFSQNKGAGALELVPAQQGAAAGIPLPVVAAAAAVGQAKPRKIKRRKSRYDPIRPGIVVDLEHLNNFHVATGVVDTLYVVKQLGSGGNATVWRVRRLKRVDVTAAAGCAMAGGVASSVQPQAKGAAEGDTEAEAVKGIQPSSAGGAGGTVAARQAVVAAEQAAPEAADDGAIEFALKVGIYHEHTQQQYRDATTPTQHATTNHGMLQLEVGIMEAAAENVHVINCYGSGRLKVQYDHELYCMLLELSELGSLDQLVRPGGVPRGLAPESAHTMVRGIMQGLSYVHNSVGAIHRDLKCSNIALSGDSSSPVPKLIDFGCALRPGRYLDALGLTYNIGTPAFKAPEQRQGCFHDTRVDSFQLGMTFIEMRFGEELPFYHLWVSHHPGMLLMSEEEQQEQLRRRGDLVAELERPDCPYNQDWPDGRVKLTPAELDFVMMCLQSKVAARPTVLRLFRSSYVLGGPDAEVVSTGVIPP